VTSIVDTSLTDDARIVSQTVSAPSYVNEEAVRQVVSSSQSFLRRQGSRPVPSWSMYYIYIYFLCFYINIQCIAYNTCLASVTCLLRNIFHAQFIYFLFFTSFVLYLDDVTLKYEPSYYLSCVFNLSVFIYNYMLINFPVYFSDLSHMLINSHIYL